MSVKRADVVQIIHTLAYVRFRPCGALADDDELLLLSGRRGAEKESSGSEEKVDRPMPRRCGRAKRFPESSGASHY